MRYLDTERNKLITILIDDFISVYKPTKDSDIRAYEQHLWTHTVDGLNLKISLMKAYHHTNKGAKNEQ